MRAALLAGHKDSGKTQLAESLCRVLREMEVKVAVAKFSHHELDRRGSDTQRLTGAADAVLAFDPDTSSLSLPGKRSLQDLLPLISAQVLLVEGGKHLRCLPRIVLPRPGDDLGELDAGLSLARWSSDPESGADVLSDPHQAARLILERGFLLPDLDCGGCGRNDCAELAREIVAGKAEASECTALSTQGIEIAVNGQTVPLNPFVRTLMQNTLNGMLSSLKGCGTGRVEIRMDTSGQSGPETPDR
jgi:molybdopterin-guanine dinucleotide biosynthesis protein B